MKARILYLPIETKARELLGKVLLASRAAERGWQVLMGPRRRVEEAVPSQPPGVYVSISIPEVKAGRLAAFRSMRHRIANICEESVVYLNGRDYCQRKVGPSAIAAVDAMLVVGKQNENDVREHRPESAAKLVVTGNPRFDTLLPNLRAVYGNEASKIRSRLGHFLLVNTNFGRVNPFRRRRDILAMLERRGAVADEAHGDLLRDFVAYKRRQMELLRLLLVATSESGAFARIVVRPHPTENHDTWRQWALPGVDVCFEGSANSWMLAAATVLHSGCTTGVEGLLLDRPVASFVPEPDSPFLNQADGVSAQVRNADELLAWAAEWHKGNMNSFATRFSTHRADLNELVANVDPPLAVDRILDALEGLDLPEAPLGLGQRSWGDAMATFRSRFRSAVASPKGTLKRRQKFPVLKAEEITTPIEIWVEAGVLKRVPNLRPFGGQTWVFS